MHFLAAECELHHKQAPREPIQLSPVIYFVIIRSEMSQISDRSHELIRREFLKNVAVLASGLAAKLSYGATPCPPQIDDAASKECSLSNLERRTFELTSGNTPILNSNYFRSEEGDIQIKNNRTAGQGSVISYGVEGIYYDPIRRRMHQCDRQHNGLMEHAYYDEVEDEWTKVDTSLIDSFGIPGHWRATAFVPETGFLYYQKEGHKTIFFYDPNANVWSQTAEEPLLGELTELNAVKGMGYHPNLFGPGKPGLLVTMNRWFLGYNLTTEKWHSPLNSSGPMGEGNPLAYCSHGQGWYFPGRDELLLTSRSHENTVNGINTNYAVGVGAGLETDLQVGSGVDMREQPPRPISGLADTAKCYAAFHPSQPDVLLAFPADNDEVWYTADAAETPWIKAPFTHPFASELGTGAQYNVGSIPQHGVVAGCASTADNTRFVFWKPPLVENILLA